MIRIEEQIEAKKVAAQSPPFSQLFERHGVSVGLYAPRTKDLQSAHDRDELYIVSSGTARFWCGDQVVDCNTGDLLFAPAGTKHHFENIGAEFRTWVVFFGPQSARATDV